MTIDLNATLIQAEVLYLEFSRAMELLEAQATNLIEHGPHLNPVPEYYQELKKLL